MRAPSQILLLAVVAAAFGCSQSIRPGATPSLGDDTGIVVLVVDTDTPLRDVTFNQVDTFDGFKIDYADRGRSVHLFEVDAERYRLTGFDSGSQELTPEAGGELCVLVKAGQLNYPGHFVYRNSEQKKGFRTYANWQWRQDEEDMKRRVTIEWTDLLASYPVKSTACP
ncbi:MAG: hypothetical protein AAFN74_10970 [Myxococcota bacterium]